jgi:hypothetical protein
VDVSSLDPRPETIQRGQETAEPGNTDRRRLGRAEQVHPALVPLLRQPAGADDTVVATTDTRAGADDGSPPPASTRDDLGLARGIAFALLLMLPFWCAVAFAIRGW